MNTTIRHRSRRRRPDPELSIDGARREFDYQVGESAYWPPGNDFEMTIGPLD